MGRKGRLEQQKGRTLTPFFFLGEADGRQQTGSSRTDMQSARFSPLLLLYLCRGGSLKAVA